MNNAYSLARVLFSTSLLSAALVACSLTPSYHRPELATPTAFKEAAPPEAAAHTGTWAPARPAEAASRGAWWTVFGDPALDSLETQALAANQQLKAAAARVAAARAIQSTARAGLFPTLDAGAGPTRERLSAASQLLPDGTRVPSQTLWRAQASASYEVDLFGRVAANIAAARADSAQSAALFESVRLSLQADVAQNYFNVRELDGELAVLARTVSLREQASTLLQHRLDEGDIGELDVARARSELATARAESVSVARQRAAAEHSLAVLLGKSPAEFSMAAAPLLTIPAQAASTQLTASPLQSAAPTYPAYAVSIPAGLPSTLLERRPDIAAAEDAMMAANARIGMARAAFFPSLSLTGSAGFESATLGDLLNWSSRAFVLGPLVGTVLSVPIFDGGARRGRLKQAKARYDEESANYRQQVLQAFQEVEDNLANLRLLDEQIRQQSTAVTASGRALALSQHQYAEGQTSYLDVIDADRSALQSQRSAVQLAGAQAVSTVNLIRALGGGWGS